jgi:bleomycin hydrolase
MNKLILSSIVFFITLTLTAQVYEFTPVIDIEASSVKSQGRTGTCWSFSTSSFIESEIFRKTGKNIDISEMFTVRNIYEDKAWNYVMRQGKSQFSEGGLAHDVINSIRKNGIVPETIFSGIKLNGKSYNHGNIIPAMKIVLDDYIKNDKDSKHPNWRRHIKKILDSEIGKKPMNFTYDGVAYTPKSFADSLKINADEYVTLTSFSHVPYYKNFILSIPDNFSNGSMLNLPLNKFVATVNYALKNGYTIALDVDVSEETFSAKHGIAVLPKKDKENSLSKLEIVKEKEITQAYRQQEFENYNTTDDHLMHIVGIVKDQKGNKYYKVKNSWGGDSDRIGNHGYVYMSIPYFKMKAISVLVNKNALPKNVQKEIKKSYLELLTTEFID